MIKEKITQRFDTVEVPRTITINDISLAMNINLVSESNLTYIIIQRSCQSYGGHNSIKRLLVIYSFRLYNTSLYCGQNN